MEGANSDVPETEPLLQPSRSQSLYCVVNVETSENDTLHQSGHTHNQDGGTKTDKTKAGFRFSRLSRRSKYVLALCTMAECLASCAFSLLAPFYPMSAEKKGMSLTLIEFVFSAFEIVIFISSPVIGNYLTKIGPKFVYISGIVVGGVGIILFGILDKSPPGLPYIVISILCRSTEAIGFAALITASFAIVSSEFPENIGTVFAIVETVGGVGYMVGPTIGGALYELGGYGMPFYTMGVLVLLNGALIYEFLPIPQSVENKRKGSIWNLLRDPMMIIPMGSIVLGGIGTSILDSTFANHLEPFGLTSAVVGLVFTMTSVMFCILAPMWGYIVDTKNIQASLIVFGLFLLGLGYMMVGPTYLLPFLPFEMWTLVTGLMFMGSSFGCVFIPTMVCMVKEAVELGYENNMDTYGLVSGLFTSLNSFGSFVGPLAGSAIIQQYEYRVGYSIVAFMCFMWMVVSALFFSCRYCKGRGKYTCGNEVDNFNVIDGKRQKDTECKDVDKEILHSHRNANRLAETLS